MIFLFKSNHWCAHPPCTTTSEVLLPLLLLWGGVLASLGSSGPGLSLLTGWNRMVAAVLGDAMSEGLCLQRARVGRATHTRRKRSPLRSHRPYVVMG